MRIGLGRRSGIVALAVIAALAVGGLAYAVIPGRDGTIHACFKKQNGQLRVVESETECRSSEKAISWSQTSPFEKVAEVIGYTFPFDFNLAPGECTHSSLSVAGVRFTDHVILTQQYAFERVYWVGEADDGSVIQNACNGGSYPQQIKGTKLNILVLRST